MGIKLQRTEATKEMRMPLKKENGSRISVEYGSVVSREKRMGMVAFQLQKEV